MAKWLEAAAYLLYRKEDKQIRAWFDEAVNDIIQNQQPNGYFNSYFQVYDPDSIFQRRVDHELYCAGHLFEAAVAASEYLKDNRLLSFSEKYVDYIYDRFVVKKDTGFITPGHEEIELALFKLYRFTGKEKYKELAEFFINERGVKQEDTYKYATTSHMQSHIPVREQFTAEGHAVRALYLYIAMADMAFIERDEELKNAVENIYNNIVGKRMYITGGVGSSHKGENFTVDYDLPNFTSYSETCAAIALAFFCDRMLKLTGEAKYGALFERVLYNALMVGISLAGDTFFYVNPLEMYNEKADYHRGINLFGEAVPIAERVKVFTCSCCPPNLCRFFEELPQFIWYKDEEKKELTVSQLISSSLCCDMAKVELVSGFPYNGKVCLKVDSYGKRIRLRIRIPEWCETSFENVQDGYLIFEDTFDNEEIDLEFPFALRKIYANSLVREDAGKVAFSYGPLILCAEEVDNDFALTTVRVKDLENAKITILDGSLDVLRVKLPIKIAKETEGLYSYIPSKTEENYLTLLPYFAWANRGANDMQVWFTEE